VTRKINYFTGALTLILGLALNSNPCFAASTSTGQGSLFGGLLLGIASVDNNVGTGIGFGVQGGYFFHDSWGVGAYYRNGNHDNSINSNLFIGEFLYRFTSMLNGLQLGANLGWADFSANGNGDGALAFGGKVAFDYSISQSIPLSIGLDVPILFTEPGTTTFVLFAPQATLRYWL